MLVGDNTDEQIEKYNLFSHVSASKRDFLFCFVACLFVIKPVPSSLNLLLNRMKNIDQFKLWSWTASSTWKRLFDTKASDWTQCRNGKIAKIKTVVYYSNLP